MVDFGLACRVSLWKSSPFFSTGFLSAAASAARVVLNPPPPA